MIPTYNQANFIRRAIESALSQDYGNLEVVVSDDCPTDNTAEVVSKYLSDPRLKYYKNQSNLGRVGNYKYMLENLATGEWVVNLDGDDYYTDNNFINYTINLILSYRDAGIVLAQAGHLIKCQHPFHGEDKAELPYIKNEYEVLDGKEWLLNFLKYKHFSHLTTLYNRNRAISIGFYQQNILSSDMESILRLAIHGKVLLIKKNCAVWLKHTDNICSTANLSLLTSNLLWIYSCYDYALKNGVAKVELARWKDEMLQHDLFSIFEQISFSRENKSTRALNSLQYFLYLLTHHKRYLLRPNFTLKMAKLFFHNLNGAFKKILADRLTGKLDILKMKMLSREIKVDNLRRICTIIPKERKSEIVEYIHNLGPGGAERQMCNLSVRLTELGLKVNVLTSYPLEGEGTHYLPYLIDKNVPARMISPSNPDTILRNSADQRVNVKALRYVPSYLAGDVYALANELILIKPDILHCWLDPQNVIGGIVGFITGVPRIILSCHSVNPSHFPLTDFPWFCDWYKILIRSNRVILLNNSNTGAKDYARWLGIPEPHINVIYNGVDFDMLDKVNKEEAMSFRKSLGIPEETPLIGGALRLYPEKKPLDFIAAIKMIKKEVADIKAVIVGSMGILEDEVRQKIGEEGLDRTVILLGKRTDIYTIMKACDVMLLTSEYEGISNVLLEAQYLGIPVVATNGGGTPETVEDGVSGLLVSVGDIEGLSACVIRLLHDRAYAKKMGEAGHKNVKEKFSNNRMAEDTLKIYYG